MNNHISCDTLKKAPIEAFPKAIHSGKRFNLLTEHKMIDLQKVFIFLSNAEWFRQVSSVKTISLAGQAYYLSKAIPNEKIRITFDAPTQHLFFHNVNELFLKLPIKGISVEKLMGGLFDKTALPNVQLQIPFEWEDIKVSTTFLYSG